MNTSTFPQKVYPQTEKPDTNLSVSAGMKRLRHLGDGSRLKAYLKDHEAQTLIVLAILLIAGTVLYEDVQPSLVAASAPPQTSAVLQLAKAPIPDRPTDELSSALAQQDPSGTASSIANPPSQSAGLMSSRKRNHQLIKRKAIHRHHRR